MTTAAITPEPDSTRATRILGGYVLAAGSLALTRVALGTGSVPVVVAYALLFGAIVGLRRTALAGAADWLPLLALPVLYVALPSTAISIGPYDGAIQHLDRALFGADPARSFAGAAPWQALSELLHAAYLSYYLIIYVPPLLMYVRGDRAAFRATVLGFTVAMVACFSVFCVFRVDGPRYLWPAPAGVPDGFFRQLTVGLLAAGSSRGTAFPSSHEAIALVMGLSSYRWDRRVGIGVLALSMLLGVGAVYAGYHYAADMIAGAVVGGLSWGVASRIGPGSPKPLWIKDVDIA